MFTVLIIGVVTTTFVYSFGYFVGHRHAREEYEELTNYYTKRVLEMQEEGKKK